MTRLTVLTATLALAAASCGALAAGEMSPEALMLRGLADYDNGKVELATDTLIAGLHGSQGWWERGAKVGIEDFDVEPEDVVRNRALKALMGSLWQQRRYDEALDLVSGNEEALGAMPWRCLIMEARGTFNQATDCFVAAGDMRRAARSIRDEALVR